MLYVNLERKWKLSVSGSITNFLNDISENNTFSSLFKYWFNDKFEEEEGKLWYLKRMTDERFDVDEELLNDIKRVFEERFYKKIEKEKAKIIEQIKKQKVETATDKQMKYARKLYIKVYGEVKEFDDKEYSKHEMILIIGDLVYRVDNMEQGDCGEGKILELSDFRK
ncbi:hypothetical protein K2F40_15605 [Clostridium sp. CM028]|uniref:hypothetical protein n=1 Tax=Clostridium sp. CM028 TaxID=2851575 RepID=UPI001C6EDC88|nr:hypothetical protein [Clostridium sp. CM028]MBW9150385.1 hypothetical protein [Clostridium sp. CM028]WLC63559.1 hypothetical protein KTC94_17425 [Clostridium sp. CM028]